MNSRHLQPLTDLLKAARLRKHLSQRDLAEKVGLPQSHISKIESAGVDLRTSNLIELARALDLELALVPRSMLPAVQALQRQSSLNVDQLGESLNDDAISRIARHARALAPRFPNSETLEQLATAADELRQQRYGILTATAVQDLAKQIQSLLAQIAKLPRKRTSTAERLLDQIQAQVATLSRLTGTSRPRHATPLPAYRLDEEEDEFNG